MKTNQLFSKLTFTMLLLACIFSFSACENKEQNVIEQTPEDALVGTWRWDASDGFVILNLQKQNSTKTFTMTFSNNNTFKGSWTATETNMYFMIEEHNGESFSNSLKYDYILDGDILILTDDDDVMTYKKQ